MDTDWISSDLPAPDSTFDTSQSGPQGFTPEELKDPVAILNKLFDPACYELILKETNLKLQDASMYFLNLLTHPCRPDLQVFKTGHTTLPLCMCSYGLKSTT